MAEHTNASRRRRSHSGYVSRVYVVVVDVVLAVLELVVVVVLVVEDVLDAVTVVVTVVGGPLPWW